MRHWPSCRRCQTIVKSASPSHVLPPFWQTVTLFNPVVYLVSGFRWAFYGIADVNVGISLGMTFVFLAICLATVAWIFKTGYRIKN